ncbi:hypothetical protein BSY238_147 [Methyloversatilis sp. RAC08]|nr:hypothetical protein BSY238_147 [Methyloversatilis sp. RAC08]
MIAASIVLMTYDTLRIRFAGFQGVCKRLDSPRRPKTDPARTFVMPRRPVEHTMSNVAPCIGINDGPVTGTAPRGSPDASALAWRRMAFIPRSVN